jgi:aryl-phospho-beta-D-glucosidase BglC (GH1 family)
VSGFSLFGVNLSGAEYNPAGTRGVGYDYTYPTHAEIDYFASKGMTAIRLPFLLERVDPVAGGPLSATQLSYIDDVVNYAGSKGIDVILDPHDFGTEYGTVIGSTAASNATFANFWGELAGHFASTSNVLFGLMNEPNAVTPTQWVASANAAIAAIRAAGATTQQILVPGTDWDSAATWVSSGNAQVLGSGIVDPSNNFAFEVHQYLDSDGSGTHSSVVSTTIGVERLTAITQWAEATGNKLFLGEFGVASDPTSLTALNNMLGYMAQHTDVWEGGTYWAAGAWWGPYMYSVEPTNGVDKPQMGVLDQYIQRTIETDGSTGLMEFGGHYYLVNDAGTGPELQYQGAPVTAGQFGTDVPIGAEQTSSGYDVAFKDSSTGLYTIWATDSNGNFTSVVLSNVSATNPALETIENTFQQDLNGDGTIGLVGSAIEAHGSTSLLQVGHDYDLDSISSGTGPELQRGGAPVTVGEYAGWTVIGAEQLAGGGYDVALKNASTGQYSVWSTNSNGNYLSSLITQLAGNSIALESVENTFHQDLNGDGVVGLVTTAIQTNGQTSLTEVGNQYFIDGGNGSDVALKYAGANVVAGQRGGWTPIGAEQTSSGYEVAWKLAGADQYTVWDTNSHGNYVSRPFGIVSGTSTALEAVETSFHQDLNGDGVIGFAVAANATLDVGGVHSDNITFEGSTGTLKLDSPSTFTGQIVDFTGDGTLSGSDQVDLPNMSFSSAIQSASSYDPSTGALTVTNDVTVDVLHFMGSYSQANFKFASDAHGGTIVYDPPITTQGTPADASDEAKVHITGDRTIDGAGSLDGQQVVVDSGATLTLDHATTASGTITNDGTVKVTDHSTVSLAAGAGHDNFVFAPDFGQATISHFTPGTDSVLIDHTIFSSLEALFAATHDFHGSAVITDAAHDTITFENVTRAQLLAHQSDFHLS